MQRLTRRGQQLIEVMLANRELNLVEGSLLWTHGQFEFGQNERFFWESIPRLNQLNPKLRGGEPLDEIRRATRITRDFWGKSPASQSKLWSSQAASLVMMIGRPPFARTDQYDHSRTFRDIERLVTECHHPRWPIPALVAAGMPDKSGLNRTPFSAGGNQNYIQVYKLDPDLLLAHYDRLIESKQPWAEFYGRCGLWGEAVRTRSKSKAEINAEYESLQKFLITWRKKYPDSDDLIADIDLILTTVRNANESAVAESITVKTPPAPSVGGQRPSPSGKEQQPPSDLPIARFEPVDDTPAPFEVITNCGDKLDAVWNSDHLWLMPVEGELQPIFDRPQLAMKYSRDFLHDVHFDGRWLWVVTAESGLRVFDLSGQMLGHLPAQSSKENSPDSDTLIANATQLPPFDPKPYPLHNEPFPGIATRTATSLKILPFGEGRCVVAANYGPLHRLWIAVVTLKPAGSWEVKIVQEGTKVPQVGDVQQFQNADIATEAIWLTRFEKPQPIPRPLAILGRKISPFHTNQVPPLAIDLTSLKVTALPGNFREDGAFWLPVVAANGRLIQNTNHLFETIEPIFQKPDAPWKSELFIASPKRDNTITVQGRFVINGDNVLVVTYQGWARLNTQTWKFDLIGPRPLPKQHRFAYQGSSVHHGLVAWNRNSPLHRVILNDEPSNPPSETKP